MHVYVTYTLYTESEGYYIYIFNVSVLTVTCYMRSYVYSINALLSPKF